MDHSSIDTVFRRVKDTIIILTAILAFVGGGIKFYSLPDIVTAHSSDISNLKKIDEAHALRIQAVEINGANQQKTLDEIKKYQLETLARLGVKERSWKL